MQNRNDTDNNGHFNSDYFNQLGHAGNLLPGNERNGTIANVNQVIAYQQYFIDLLAKVEVPGQQCRHKKVAVPIAAASHKNNDEHNQGDKDRVTKQVVIHNILITIFSEIIEILGQKNCLFQQFDHQFAQPIVFVGGYLINHFVGTAYKIVQFFGLLYKMFFGRSFIGLDR